MLTMSRSRFIETPATMSKVIQQCLHRQCDHARAIEPQSHDGTVQKNEIPHDGLENFAIIRHPLSWLPAFWNAQRRTGWPAAAGDQTLHLTSWQADSNLNFEKWVRRLLDLEHGFQSRYFRRWFGRNLDETTAAPFEVMPMTVTNVLAAFEEPHDQQGLRSDIGLEWSGYRSTEHYWQQNWRRDEMSWTDPGLVRAVVTVEAPIVARFYGQMDFVATCPKG